MYTAVVDVHGVGDELILGRIARTRASAHALRNAVEIAFARGEHQVAEEHVLLALAADARVQPVVDRLGLDDVREVIEERFPPRRGPVAPEQALGELIEAMLAESHREAIVPVPAFERFTGEARRVIRAAAETPRDRSP